LRTSAAKLSRGFTLIEVVVAFVLLALVLSTGFEIFSSGLARAGMLEERSRALEVARSQLAEAGMQQGLKDGVTQGDSDDPRFHWITTVKRIDVGTDPANPVSSRFDLFEVDVKVDWRGSDARDHSLSLASAELSSRQ
jgi:general secretion pathway protein I